MHQPHGAGSPLLNEEMVVGGGMSSISHNKRKKVYAKTDGHCAYCGKLMGPEDFVIDHVNPKSNGGKNEIENLLPACNHCNLIKRDFTLEEFRHFVELLPEKLLEVPRFRFWIRIKNLSFEIEPHVFWFEKRGDVD